MGAFRNAAKNKLTAQLLAPTAARGGVIAQLDPVPHTLTSMQQGWELQEEVEEQVEEESERNRKRSTTRERWR